MQVIRQQNKVKLIAWCVAFAAVTVLYTLVHGQNRDAETAMRVSDTTASVAPAPAMTAPPATVAPTPDTRAPAVAMPKAEASPAPAAATTAYKDGTYAASGSYRTPLSTETIAVTLTVQSDTVSDVSIQQVPQNRDAVVYQAAFRQNYKPFVVGKKLTDLRLSRVSGSSLTSIGFNEALDQIKAQATQG